MTKDELFGVLKNVLINDFDVEEELVKPEANIVKDLDLDSIDAVELIVKMKPYVNGKIAPAMFKNVKTCQDTIDLLYPLLKQD